MGRLNDFGRAVGEYFEHKQTNGAVLSDSITEYESIMAVGCENLTRIRAKYVEQWR